MLMFVVISIVIRINGLGYWYINYADWHECWRALVLWKNILTRNKKAKYPRSYETAYLWWYILYQVSTYGEYSFNVNYAWFETDITCRQDMQIDKTKIMYSKGPVPLKRGWFTNETFFVTRTRSDNKMITFSQKTAHKNHINDGNIKHGLRMNHE